MSSKSSLQFAHILKMGFALTWFALALFALLACSNNDIAGTTEEPNTLASETQSSDSKDDVDTVPGSSSSSSEYAPVSSSSLEVNYVTEKYVVVITQPVHSEQDDVIKDFPGSSEGTNGYVGDKEPCVIYVEILPKHVTKDLWDGSKKEHSVHVADGKTARWYTLDYQFEIEKTIDSLSAIVVDYKSDVDTLALLGVGVDADVSTWNHGFCVTYETTDSAFVRVESSDLANGYVDNELPVGKNLVCVQDSSIATIKSISFYAYGKNGVNGTLKLESLSKHSTSGTNAISEAIAASDKCKGE